MQNNYREFQKAMIALGCQPDWAGMVADVIADDLSEGDKNFDEIFNGRMSKINVAIAKVQIKRAELAEVQKNWDMGFLTEKEYQDQKEKLEKL